MTLQQVRWLPMVILVACASREQAGTDAVSESDDIVPANLAIPHVNRPACPGEGCAYGEWMACDTVFVHARETTTSPVAFQLAPMERFEVTEGATHILTAGVVVVKRPQIHAEYARDPVEFQAGDTVYVLDYLGEGFFNTWYRDTMLETEVFWPWEPRRTGPDYDFAGDMVQEPRTQFWVAVGHAKGSGYVFADSAELAPAYSLDDEPLRCPG